MNQENKTPGHGPSPHAAVYPLPTSGELELLAYLECPDVLLQLFSPLELGMCHQCIADIQLSCTLSLCKILPYLKMHYLKHFKKNNTHN